MKHFISVFTATILSLTLSLGTAFAQAGVAGTVIMAAGQVTAKNAHVERVLSRRSGSLLSKTPYSPPPMAACRSALSTMAF